MTVTYKPTWTSLKVNLVPRWLDEGKFGIYTHWGVYSVPACGPNGSWYPHNMYIEGTEQYKYHVEHYGDPSKFGYKDFIPMFKAEKFDPDEWAELFARAGAKFAGPVVEHHDGFSMWDSEVNEWNAARMGPERDVVGELEKAIRKRGMKFMVAFHHAENWWFFPHITGFDTSDPRYSGLYGKVHDVDGGPEVWRDWYKQEKPDEGFLQNWKAKIVEVVDKYKPDLMWFDFGLQFVREKYRKEAIAYYLNKAVEWNRQVGVVFKRPGLPPGVGIEDLELGRMGTLTYHNWITDTDIAVGGRWSYIHGIEYKSTTAIVHNLIDNVSKNGYLLLNVGPKADGEIPKPARERLLELGRWLEVNGEAIYGTTAWVIHGEGPTEMRAEGSFSESEEVQYDANDKRFTVKDTDRESALYAFCLGWPGESKEVTIRALRLLYRSDISSVEMLGADENLDWALTEDGLKVRTPSRKPCEHACTFKILMD
jgi:alpha-L-fucosidase